MSQAKKTLVVCYSLEGSTARLAKALAQATGGEVKQIKPVKEIPHKGFGKFFLGGMQAIFKQTPPLAQSADPAGYDLVIVGAPTWGGHLASPMRSWLKQVDLSGKRVAIYATCLGNVGKTLSDMRELLGKAQVIGEHGFLVSRITVMQGGNWSRLGKERRR